MNHKLTWSIFTLAVCIGVTLRFSTSHEKMPIGCDEFGYLNLSKAMDNGVTFSDHTSRPYIEKLLDTLRSEGIDENEMAWMIAPHAYHLIPGSDKIINQYPPGTSFLLHLLPEKYRKITFPLLTMLLLFMVPLFALYRLNNTTTTWFQPVFAILIFLFTVSAPFVTELTRVNSLALTFGILIAAGMLLKNFPLWSLFLVAITINFRSANALMLIPVFLFMQPTFGKWLSFKNVVVAAAIVIVALSPTFYYNFMITGNPAESTYSAIDQSFSISDQNARYYLSFEQHWLRVHLIAFTAILLFVIFKKASWRLMFLTMVFAAVNYLFFIFHTVKMDYYPYASAMLITGIALGLFAELRVSGKFVKPVNIMILIFAIIVLAGGINRYKKREHISFDEAGKQYASLCNYDVVWGDLFSGTSEYVCNNNGFRYGVSSPRARKAAMIFLNRNNYSQAILIDDNSIEESIVLNEVMESGLSYIQKNDPVIGKYIVIR